MRYYCRSPHFRKTEPMSQQENDTKADTGIYVHIPFCQSKCPYCDFYSITDTSRIPEFLKALKVEMKLAATTGTRADTLYIGGGTEGSKN